MSTITKEPPMFTRQFMTSQPSARRSKGGWACLAIAVALAGSWGDAAAHAAFGTESGVSVRNQVDDSNGNRRWVEQIDCAHQPSACGPGGRAASINNASASTLPTQGAISGQVAAASFNWHGEWSSAKVDGPSRWWDTLTITSSTLPVGTPVDLTLKVDFAVSYQWQATEGRLCLPGVGGDCTYAQGYASFCPGGRCYTSGNYPALVWSRLSDAAGVATSATDTFRTRVGATEDMSGLLIMEAWAYGWYPDSYMVDMVASAHYYVDGPAGVNLNWASGHDYTAAVPEPATMSQWLGGLLALGWLRRRSLRRYR